MFFSECRAPNIKFSLSLATFCRAILNFRTIKFLRLGLKIFCNCKKLQKCLEFQSPPAESYTFSAKSYFGTSLIHKLTILLINMPIHFTPGRVHNKMNGNFIFTHLNKTLSLSTQKNKQKWNQLTRKRVWILSFAGDRR